MRGRDRVRRFQKMSHRPLHLGLAGAAVAGENLFYFPCRNLYGRDPALTSCDMKYAAHFSQCDARLGIALERKHPLDNGQSWLFRLEDRTKLGKDVI